MTNERTKKTFNQLKVLSRKSKKSLQYHEDEKAYHVFLIDDSGIEYSTNIFKSSFLNDNRVIGVNIEENNLIEEDFLNNYKNDLDSHVVSKPKTDDARDYVYTSSRPVGTHTYFTSEGDDISDYKKIGDGTEFYFDHIIGNTEEPLYLDCNVIDNPTYIHEGYISYVDCHFDKLSFHFVPRTTSYIESSNTTFNLYGGYLVIPAAGNGTIQLTETPNLVAVGTDDDGNKLPGYWDAEFNYETGVFDNLRPNAEGQGNWNIFAEEIILYRMLQKVILVGSGEKYLETSEHGAWIHGTRLKVSYNVSPDDHNFKISGILVLYRDKVGLTTR